MVDKAQAEITAIRTVFPNASIHLCYFHFAQAWERWLKDGKNGVTKRTRPRLGCWH